MEYTRGDKMKTLLDAFDCGLRLIEGSEPMNPECCDYEMMEIESTFENDIGETEVVGYECVICERKINLNGEEIPDEN